ncbi:hypothetical protein HYPSUDRAFT_329818 [Hypholoma sublateritium FD-334 SS-4]|uniref:Uncharacterized protein n=1 Tax=Hypholoma sublateritium (strain FD-334 SS-4) TaxID=945553 RepID=A0A0D2NGZ9_HYPSF|nr:hypothetical protein HYPSUDRAFT_329818 [Hypholoma sublateritium FD-334 SS-4]
MVVRTGLTHSIRCLSPQEVFESPRSIVMRREHSTTYRHCIILCQASASDISFLARWLITQVYPGEVTKIDPTARCPRSYSFENIKSQYFPKSSTQTLITPFPPNVQKPVVETKVLDQLHATSLDLVSQALINTRALSRLSVPLELPVPPHGCMFRRHVKTPMQASKVLGVTFTITSSGHCQKQR